MEESVSGVDRKRVDDKDGWIPVVCRQGKQIVGDGKVLFSLFVDNLPEDTSHSWLKKLFNNFGVVKDVFIPSKRSKATGKRFGFVRYDCAVSADVAISKSHGLWIDNCKLFVQMARFGNGEKSALIKNNFIHKMSTLKVHSGMKSNNIWKETECSQQFIHSDETSKMMGGLAPIPVRKSFAQIVKGNKESDVFDKMKENTIKMQPVGFDWLLRSAVAKLHLEIQVDDLVKQLKLEMMIDVHIRRMGGRSFLLTFLSIEDRNDFLRGKCLNRWFSDLKPWAGEAAGVERYAWLSCFGVPLSVWSPDLFKRIGNIWGSFILTDENTLKLFAFDKGRVLIATEVLSKIDSWITVDVNGTCYPVRVKEEKFFECMNVNGHGCSTCCVSRASEKDAGDDVEKDAGDDVVAFSDKTANAVKKGIDSVHMPSKINIRTLEVEHVLVAEKTVEETIDSLQSRVADSYEAQPDLMGSMGCSESWVGDSLLLVPRRETLGIGSDALESKALNLEFIGADLTKDSPALEEATNSVEHVAKSVDEVADSMENLADLVEDLVDDDDCTSFDLVSADPLINYVKLKRHKKKNRTKQGVRRKSIPLWRYNPLKASLFSRTYSLDNLENNSRRLKLDSKNTRRKGQSSLNSSINTSLSLGDSHPSDLGPMHMSQEEVSSFEKRFVEEFIASKSTKKILDINLLPGDEAILKEMIEADLKRTPFSG